MFGRKKEEEPKTTIDIANKAVSDWLDSIFRGDTTGMHMDNGSFFACRLCGTWLDHYPDMRLKHLEHYHKDKWQEYHDFLIKTKIQLDDEERGIGQV